MFPQSSDQALLAETTKKFLEAECPLPKIRELADSTAGFEPEFWRDGAELGWTSLVVPKEAGGGSVSEGGVRDLALVAYQFGLHAAPGPLSGTNVVAAALGRWGTEEQQIGPLGALLRGEAVSAWALAEPAPHGGFGQVGLRATETPHGFRLDGAKTPGDGGAEAAHVLVVARHVSGLSQFLLSLPCPGLTIVPLEGLDLTRRFARLEFDGVQLAASSLVGAAGAAAPDVEWLTDLAVTVQLGEMCGAMQWAFDTTVQWAMNRYSFGRPLASYQEIKHRFADMKMWLEASFAITAQAAAAIDSGAPNRSELVSAGKFFIGRYGVELLQDCVQLHGGIGVTFDHDLHLFLRRVVCDAALVGTPSEHAARLTDILEEREAGR